MNDAKGVTLVCTFKPGDWVTLLAIKTTGIVRQIAYDGVFTIYSVDYWNGGSRSNVWVTSLEIARTGNPYL